MWKVEEEVFLSKKTYIMSKIIMDSNTLIALTVCLENTILTSGKSLGRGIVKSQ